MSFRVRLPASGEAFEADDLETVLNSALRAGVKLPSDCRQGVCGTCRIRLLEGAVEYDTEPMALAAEEAAAGFALACQARPASDLSIAVASTALTEPARRTATIRRLKRCTPDILHLELDLPEVDYAPGQYMKVRLADGTTRNFSMAGAPNGESAVFHVRVVPGGRFTEGALAGMKPGARLEIELPMGAFIFRRQDYRPVLMVATGTGVAPLRAMLESLLDDPDCPQVSLYWGMRTRADLYLDEELRSWSARLRDFRYVPVLSRADAAWRGRRGHVQEAVLEDLADLSEHAIYLCGSPSMIDDARARFQKKGVRMEYLYADGFHFQFQEELT